MKPEHILYLSCALLCGCAAAPPCVTEPAVIQYITMVAPSATPAETASATDAPAPSADIDELLAYHHAVRDLPAGDQAKELATLNGQQKQPKATLKKSMLLALSRSNGDLARALVLADSVVKSAEADALPLKPLAQMLVAQYLELRRLGEQADKLTQQTRDNQRRIEQLNDTLEALKAIERTLPSRPAPATAIPQAK